jgi:energy-coupling factor transport system permease protein
MTLATRNPVAKLAAALVLTVVLLVTLDPVTPAVVLAVELAVVPLFGLDYLTLARRSWPVLLSAAGVALSLVVFAAERTGAVLVALGPFDVTTGVIVNAVALAIRLFAVVLPGALVFASTDPTELADALIQNVKAPPRFAIGALAAFRLVPLLGAEWEKLTLARRARGLSRSPSRTFVSTAFALLVGAIRRGTRLAVAMDARGFDSGVPRSVARPQPFRGADWLLVSAAAAVAIGALALSVALGTYRSLF